MLYRVLCGAALTFSLAAPAFGQPAAPPVTNDDALLHSRALSTTPANLFHLLRSRTGVPAPQQRVEALVKQLGDPSFERRQEAARALATIGPTALDRLRTVATDDADAEVRWQARACVAAIELPLDPDVGHAAVRHLLRVRPPGTAAALVAYVPYADAETVEVIWYGIEAVGLRDGKIDPAVRAALLDPEPRRRALAAFMLARHGDAADRAAVSTRLLTERDREVRLRAAQGLLGAHDPAAIPVLLGLLRHAPLDVAWQAEELLHFLAGTSAPKPTLDVGDLRSRARCAAAWTRWWAAAEPCFDWARLDREPLRPGLVLVAFGYHPCLYGCDGTLRWRMPTPVCHVDLHLMPGPRFLILEAEGVVRERGVRGGSRWESIRLVPNFVSVASALACRRMANGNTSLILRRSRIELGPDGQKIVFGCDFTVNNVHAAVERRDGRILAVWSDGYGEVGWGEIDVRTGEILRSTDLAHDEVSFRRPSPAALPDGECLLFPCDGEIARADAEGNIRWRRPMPQVQSVAPMADGNLLAIAFEENRLVEINPAGRIVWEMLIPLLSGPGNRSGLIAPLVRDAFPLLRLGFARRQQPTFDLDSAENRTAELKAPDLRIRLAAMLALTRKGPQAICAVPALMDALKDRDMQIRFLASRTLAAIGAGAVPPLLANLREPKGAVRTEVLEVLQYMGVEARPAVPVLVEMLKDPRTTGNDRACVLRILGAIGPDAKAAIPALLAALKQADASDLWSSCYALARVGGDNEEVVAAIMDTMKYSEGPPDPSGIVTEALGHIGPDARAAIPLLIQMLGDERLLWQTRKKVAEALGRIAPATLACVKALANIVGDPDRGLELRRAALQSLTMAGPVAAAALPILQEVLCDPDCSSELQNDALRMLYAMGNEAIPVLVVLENEGNPNVRNWAANELADRRSK